VVEAVAVAPHVDAILLDSGNQSFAGKELGGTGRTHDWDLRRRIREAIDVPGFFARGLKPQNVGAAIAAVKPVWLGLCTGVRTAGKLDEAKLSAFFHAVRSASPAL